MKRLVSLVVILCMLLSCVNIVNAETSGTCGTNVTWVLDDAGTLTISGTGTMDNYNEGVAPWYNSRGNVRSIVIENGVTSIGIDAFGYCSSLTSVTIPDSVTSIGNRAFMNCDSLEYLKIPDSVTDLGDWTFRESDNLKCVIIGKSVKSIKVNAFIHCVALENVTIPKSVISIGEAVFYNNPNLTDIYYLGSEEEWNAITIGENNEALAKATVNYNSSVEEYEVEVAIEPEYIYGGINEGDDVDVSGKIDGIETADDAKNAVDDVAEALTEDQKTSPVAIDKLTLLAEEAISKALTIDLLGNVVISDELIEEVAESANELSYEMEQTLEENGVKTHRKMRRFVTINTSQRQTVTIDKGAIKADIEGVKVVTDFASVTMGTDDENIVSITNEGENAVSIEFENDDAKSVKVSFPDVETDGQFIAVVDENGKAVGGKYNPATGDVEAKISKSGIYKVMENEKNFDDIKSKSTEMQDAIKILASKGIINGTSQTTFSPDSSISRAEVAALVIRTLSKLDANEDGGFTDVTRENWYFGAAGSSKKHGIIKGYEDNTFRGTAVIAKDQIVAVAARVLKNEMNYKTPSDIDKHLAAYNDKDAIAQWAQGDVALATMADLVIRRTDGSFSGTMPMTRGDAAIIL